MDPEHKEKNLPQNNHSTQREDKWWQTGPEVKALGGRGV